MRAAIYARLSVDDRARAGTGVESIATQLANARRAADAIGATVADECVVTDDGISGAEVQRRPGLHQLFGLAEAGAIDVVITRDLDRLVRDAIRQAVVLARLDDALVRVYTYSDRAYVDIQGLGYAMTAMRGVVGEMERRQTSRRCREALERRVQMGAAAGNVPYGVRIVRDGPVPRYALVPDEAAIVAEIGRRYVECGGVLRRTALALDAAGIRSPGGRPWSRQAVRRILEHPIYRGVVRWGRRTRVYERGTARTVIAPPEQILTAAHPELAIWEPALLAQIDALLARPRQRWTGAAEPRYLASGLVRCGACGAAVVAHSGSSGGTYYHCQVHARRGAYACSGVGMRPTRAVDAAILDALEPLLDGEIAERALALLRERVDAAARPDARESERERLRRDLAVVERRAARITEAIAIGEAPAPLVTALRAESARADGLRAELSRLERAAPPAPLDAARVMRAARARLATYSALLRRGGIAARPVLAAVLGDGRMRAVPVRVDGARRWHLSASVSGGWLWCDDGTHAGGGGPPGVRGRKTSDFARRTLA